MKQLEGKNHQFPQILTIFSGFLICVSSGLLFSWTSPAIPDLIADTSLNISLDDASYFTVISPVAMMLSAPLFPILINLVGLKMAVMSTAIPQVAAWLLIGFAQNIWMFYISRIMAGIGDAAIFATLPIYVCEIAEPKVRGTWGNLVAIGLYFGIFLINVIGAYNSIRTTALICGVMSLLSGIIFIFMPESPYYLLTKYKEVEAKNSLRFLRWRSDVDSELDLLKADVKRQISESGTIKDLFTITSNRRALFICMGLRFAQQFSGLPAFELYTQYLFQQAGGSVSDKISAIIFSGVLFLSVSICAFFVEKFGRRPLMLFSSFGCAIILTIETIYFALVQFTSLDLSYLHWLPLTGMLTFVVVCATGLGILPTLMLGELFSASIKGKASFFMNVALAVCFFIVPKLFQQLTHSFGIFAPFCFFSICCFIDVAFSYFYVIETKGKTLEEIQQQLKGGYEKKHSLSV